MMKQTYKPPTITTGDLNTPVVFYSYEANDGPEPGETEKQLLHKCFALVYSPSMKDIEILKVLDTKEGMTIKIRDTKGEFTPTNKMFVEIKDYRYVNKVFNIVDVSYDIEDNNFTKLVLGNPYGR